VKKRHCNRCDKYKFLLEFAVDVSNKLGRSYRCSECCNEVRKITRRRPSVRIKDQNYRLVSKYGITLEQQKDILKSQKGRCAICGTKEPRGRFNKWQTDHDHEHIENGKVRGLLCYPCNSGLGHFKDSVRILQEAIFYLEKS
jgi:hypothetical protein